MQNPGSEPKRSFPFTKAADRERNGSTIIREGRHKVGCIPFPHFLRPTQAGGVGCGRGSLGKLAASTIQAFVPVAI